MVGGGAVMTCGVGVIVMLQANESTDRMTMKYIIRFIIFSF
jgi:hypothetical protein